MVKIVCARYNEDIRWILPMINDVIVYNKGEDNLDYISSDKIIKCKNYGREGETYIKHILDNYDNLDDYTIFIQANPVNHIDNTSEKKSYHAIWSVLKEKKNYEFKYISTLFTQVCSSELIDYSSGLPSFPMKVTPPLNINIIKYYLRLDNTINDDLLKILLYELDTLGVSVIKKHELAKIVEKYPVDELVKKNLFIFFDQSKMIEVLNNSTYTYGNGAIFISSKKQILNHSKEDWNEIYKMLQSIHPSSDYGLEKMWRYLLDEEYNN
jgi:hypothetical protein